METPENGYYLLFILPPPNSSGQQKTEPESLLQMTGRPAIASRALPQKNICGRRLRSQFSVAATRRSLIARGVSPWYACTNEDNSPNGAKVTVAPLGLAKFCASFQGLTPLAINCRPFGPECSRLSFVAPGYGDSRP